MSRGKGIYLDYQATTPVDPRVAAIMMPLMTTHFGNASSSEHRFGWEAEVVVKDARESIAAAIGAARRDEIVFTSGATEANNMAILGVARRYRHKGRHLITVCTEHSAVLDPCKAWQREGGEVTFLPVASDGLLDPEVLRQAIKPETVLISIMAANNEIGVLQPLAQLAAIARDAGVLFHTDAAQAVGKIPIDAEAMEIGLLSLSAHKFYGPKGVGALYVRSRNPRVNLQPLLFGGGHERGKRPGTLNVPGIAGMAEALSLCLAEMPRETRRLTQLRQKLWHGLKQALGGVSLNGHETQRLPGNLSISFAGLTAEQIATALPECAVSSRSACSSGSLEPSHVLRGIGLAAEMAAGTLRFGLGRFTTEAEIDRVLARLIAAVRRLRAAAGDAEPAHAGQLESGQKLATQSQN